MVTPEDNKIIVFHNGRLYGSNIFKYLGGHINPRYKLGEILIYMDSLKFSFMNKINYTPSELSKPFLQH
jgi:hypothetical protein